MQRRFKSNVASSPCCLRSPKSRCGRTRRRRNPRSRASSLRPERIIIIIIIIMILLLLLLWLLLSSLLLLHSASWDKFYYHRVSCSDHTSAILASSHSIFSFPFVQSWWWTTWRWWSLPWAGHGRWGREAHWEYSPDNRNISKFEFFLPNILQW